MSLWRGVRPSIRLRLAALLTALLVILGGTLLGVSYVLVRSNLKVHTLRPAATPTERGRVAPSPGSSGAAAHGDDATHRRYLARAQTAQEEFADDALRRLTAQYLVIMAAMGVLSAGLGWLVSGRVLRPMTEITATARRVSEESLHERIALEGPDDELKQLADTFDSMLARLEAAFERQATFISNASHELRTPLSVIRAEADVALADAAGDPQALRSSLAVVREAVERSERLIAALLALARADNGDRPRIDIDVSQLVREALDDADPKGLRLELALRPARVVGDRQLLRTMTANLIENAVRHNSHGGWIAIRTQSTDQHAQVEISNSGPHITPEDAASLTEPFRRLASARTGAGLGLGLSIAASVAHAHGGVLAIEPLERGGLRVVIRLPAAPNRADHEAAASKGDRASPRS